VRVELAERRFRFRAPLRTAYGELHDRTVLEVHLSEGDIAGVGEAAPLEPYDGVSLEAVGAALERCRPLLEDATPHDREELVDACWLEAGLPQAVAGVDLALWDLEARGNGVPLAALLGAAPDADVPLSATIAAIDRAGAAAEAAAAVRAGVRCVKVKVGVGDDAGRVAAVRAAAGPDIELRLDANGAWTVDEAVATIEALAPAGLELVEEPVHGVAAMRAVRERVAVRIAMDETAGEPGSLTAAVADAVCLKVARCGGISALLAQAALVRATGAEVYLASAYDGALGIAAAVHCAAALRPTSACGLGTLPLFAGEFDVLALEAGQIAVPASPGLGV
jgi:L-Ala-D/L-Glu epimerase